MLRRVCPYRADPRAALARTAAYAPFADSQRTVTRLAGWWLRTPRGLADHQIATSGAEAELVLDNAPTAPLLGPPRKARLAGEPTLGVL